MFLGFNEDGPVEVSEDLFLSYQSIVGERQQAKFDEMLMWGWLNENLPDGVRRLFLRDLLRQRCSASKESAVGRNYFETGYGLGRIFRVQGLGKEGLKCALSQRPKILTEIYEEFLYNLDNDVVSYGSDVDRSAQRELIELLLELSTLPRAEGIKLLSYHPVNQPMQQRDEKVRKLTAFLMANLEGPE